MAALKAIVRREVFIYDIFPGSPMRFRRVAPPTKTGEPIQETCVRMADAGGTFDKPVLHYAFDDPSKHGVEPDESDQGFRRDRRWT